MTLAVQLPLPMEEEEKPPCKAVANPGVEAALAAGVTLPPPGTSAIQCKAPHLTASLPPLPHSLSQTRLCRQEKAALATQ